MLNVLNQPYPSSDASFGQQLRKAAVIGLFVGLFLIAFQPFGLSIWETPNKLVKIAGFGLITFVVTAFNFMVWQWLFPKQFSDKQWTVGREIGLITGNILLIAIGNRLYLQWLTGEGQDSGISWPGMILITFLTGLFPVTGLVLLNYIRQLKKFSQTAAELSVMHHPLPSVTAAEDLISGTLVPGSNESLNTPLALVADNEKDTLLIAPADLLYIESSDNYCTVVYRKDGNLAKPLMRSSLSRLAGQINVPHIVRCHRSYVVNLDRIERVTGNAQGYKLHLADGQLTVPVARKYNDSLVSQLKSAT